MGEREELCVCVKSRKRREGFWGNVSGIEEGGGAGEMEELVFLLVESRRRGVEEREVLAFY